jgi:hypothetical protein
MVTRAEDEIRTRDPHLGKVMLYQLSYFRICAENGLQIYTLQHFSQKKLLVFRGILRALRNFNLWFPLVTGIVKSVTAA